MLLFSFRAQAVLWIVLTAVVRRCVVQFKSTADSAKEESFLRPGSQLRLRVASDSRSLLDLEIDLRHALALSDQNRSQLLSFVPNSSVRLCCLDVTSCTISERHILPVVCCEEGAARWYQVTRRHVASRSCQISFSSECHVCSCA